MDLDQDGHHDVVSGSWPGEIFWFRQTDDGQFAERVAITGHDGKPIKLGFSAVPHVTDWQQDGDLDLIVGTFEGKVFLVRNESSNSQLKFAKPVELKLDRPHKEHHAEAAPVVADWDGDGQADLLLGDEDGSIYWHRNLGSSTEPRLGPAQCLIPKSPIGWGNQGAPNEWGLRVKLCVTDWNADGKLDLLVGDMCGSFQGKPSQLADERAAEREALSNLPSLRRDWANCFRYYRSLPEGEAEKAESVVQELRDLKRRIAMAQQVIGKYKPQRQSHGFVWLFERK